MATGKSTVGRLVAERECARFVDLDALVEQRAGTSVARIFEEQGELAFRKLEREELFRLLDSGQADVVALGGGALCRRDARLEALDRAVVVTLEAPLEELLRRARLHSGRPLLDVADPDVRVAELLEQRRDAYLEAHARIATGGLPPAEVARRVAGVWRRNPLAVAAGSRSYAVDVGRGVAAERVADLVSGASMALLVTDSNVAPLHAGPIEAALRAVLPVERVELDPGEPHKNVGALERIWDSALRSGADRQSVVVALGGGVVGDIAGFAAATWMRGIRWVGLPTTLLAMVDASVGGKTAVDLGAGKNLIGAFWQPSAVVCDVATLATEPDRGYVAALAEVVKTALIGDPDLFRLLEERSTAVRARDPELVVELVRRSVRVKARIVGMDERESGLRAILNLGHTVGHALEAHGGYTRLGHGEAVSLGLVAALELGAQLGASAPALVKRTVELLGALGLPSSLDGQPLVEAAGLIGLDKKRAGDRLRLIVARDVGRVEAVEVDVEELRQRVLALR